jgi:enoyl-[acyl-carrier protein] reductase II
MGGDETTPDVDPDKEFWPAGQGVGAIQELTPAADLVERFVAEAEQALGKAKAYFS